jgi:Domain of unknown function (DUF1844)
MEQNDKNTQLFMYLVSSFEMAAMQGLGKINSPVSGKIEKNLEQAQFAIDVMDMIKDKTKGNLTEYETRFLDTVSAQLKLNYVDEANKKPEETKEEIKEENKEEAKKE